MRISVLCIHDCFIVDYHYSFILKQAVRRATLEVLSKEVPVAHNYVGLDEMERNTPERVEDYREARWLERSPG